MSDATEDETKHRSSKSELSNLVMCDAPTKDQVAAALNQMSIDMLNVGVAMEYLGGFNEGWKEKSDELIGAARIAKAWFGEIEGDR